MKRKHKRRPHRRHYWPTSAKIDALRIEAEARGPRAALALLWLMIEPRCPEMSSVDPSNYTIGTTDTGRIIDAIVAGTMQAIEDGTITARADRGSIATAIMFEWINKGPSTIQDRPRLFGGNVARFWTSHPRSGGWIKLALRPGDHVEWSWGGPCEEGYHWEDHRVEHEGDRLVWRSYTSSADCDGPLKTWSASECGLRPDDLRGSPAVIYRGSSRPEYYPSRPEWRPIDDECRQRDYFAEAAGY